MRREFQEEFQKQDLNTQLGRIAPNLEFFNWYRIIIDEGHEIFGELLNNIALGKYMAKWIINIDANYYWYVS